MKYKGANQAAGTFQAKQNIFGIEDGVILSTGNAKGIIGPNKYRSYTNINNQLGDSDLEKILGDGMKTFDASVLEFEFRPLKERMQMQYVLSSDEYEEFSNYYRDAVGVVVNEKNIAFVSDVSRRPVTTSSINKWETEYYISNTGNSKNTEMDGMSTVLNAISNVTVNDWNKIKLVIADGRDNGVDSNILINSIRFDDVKVPEERTDFYISMWDVQNINDEKARLIVNIKRTNNINKQDSIEWKLSLPKNATSAEDVKNKGKIIFEKNEFEKDS